MSLVFLPCVAGPLAQLNPAVHDPHWSSVVVLIHWDGTQGQTAISGMNLSTVSGAPNTVGGGNFILDTGTVKFGSASLKSTGGGAGVLPVSAMVIGTGDFTHEFWYYTTSVSVMHYLSDYNGEEDAGGTAAWALIKETNGSLRMKVNGSVVITGGASGLVINTWQAIALSRVSGTTRLFINGVQTGSNYTDTNNYSQSRNDGTWLSRDQSVASNDSGFYDEWRFTIGVGRYSGAYTPATAAFPNG